MRKRFAGIAVVAALVIGLIGCGEKPVPEVETATPEIVETVPAEDNEEPEDEKTAETEETNEPEVTPTEEISMVEDEITLSEEKDAVTGEKLELHNGAIVLHTDTAYEKEGSFRIDDSYSEILTDRAMAREWEYYYSDSATERKPVVVWTPSKGNFTTIESIIELVHLSDEPFIYGDNIKFKIVYDECGDAKTYEGTVMQENPGYISSEGYEYVRSTVFNEINKDDKIFIGFLVDIDREFHDILVAEEIEKPCWAYIDFSDGEKFCINLRSDMVIFGYDDSDSDSMITADAFRTLTGSNEQFGVNNTMEVVDIYYSDENHATVACHITTEDGMENDYEIEYSFHEELESWTPVDRKKVMETFAGQ